MGYVSGLCGPSRACFFLFCLSSARPSSRLRGWVGFLSSRFAVVTDSSTAAPHAPNRVCLGLRWCCASLLDLQKRTQGHTGASLVFLLQNKFTPPPKGGGAGHRLSWVCWSFPAEKPGAFPQEKTDTSYPMTSLAVACGNCWSQTVHTAPTGPV